MDGMEELEKCPIGASNWLIITIRCSFWCKYKQIKWFLSDLIGTKIVNIAEKNTLQANAGYSFFSAKVAISTWRNKESIILFI